MGKLVDLIGLLDCAKQRNGLTSDASLANYLDVDKAMITRYRRRQAFPRGSTTIRLAELADVSEAVCLAIVQMEKAETSAESKVWKKTASMMATKTGLASMAETEIELANMIMMATETV